MKYSPDLASQLGFDPEALHRKYLEERDKRLRPEGVGQYIDLEGNFAEYAEDPNAGAISRDSVNEDTDALIIGGGLAGLMTSVQLKKLGVERFRILDQAADFGGTWYWNRYPGIRCDVESYIYIPMLEEVGTIPSEKYAHGSEIFEHCRALARKYGLHDLALLETVVKSIRWNDELSRWVVKTNRGDEIRARFVVVSSGPLHKAKLPGIPGIKDFKGVTFHTSRWDYDYTGGDSTGGLTGLQGKRVALIGTGATGIQVLPHIAEWAEHVYVFQRTPGVVDQRNNRPTDVEWFKSQPPGWQQARMDNFDQVIMGTEQKTNLVDDCWTDVAKLLVGFNAGEFPAMKDASPEELYQFADFVKMEQVRARIGEIVKDPKTAESLKPWYNLFCKRPLFSDDYLQTFNRPNVTLVDTHGQGVERITETGLISEGVEYPADCIIFATGFRAGAYSYESGGYVLEGRNGVSLKEKWSTGVRSVHGLQVSGFPNFHIVGTLAQASQSFNYPHVTSRQTQQAARLIARCLKDNVRVMEVTEEAEQRWAAEMAAKAKPNATFEVECTPGYYNNEGKTDERPSLFGQMYGGGPFEYRAILDRWFESDHQKDAVMQRE